jgi:hypothetical protein
MIAPSMIRALVVAVLLASSTAEARVTFFSEADLGGRFFLGDSGDNAAVGPAFGVTAGVQFAPWVHLGLALGASTHEATVPPPPDQEFFQVYTGAAELRLGFRAGQVGVFAQGRGGVAAINTNVLDGVGITTPEQHWGFFAGGGAGVLLHTGNPRFAFGLGGDWLMVPAFDGFQAVTVRLFLRYAR